MRTTERDLTGGEPALYVMVTQNSRGGESAHAPVNRRTLEEDLEFMEWCGTPVLAIHEFLYNGEVRSR